MVYTKDTYIVNDVCTEKLFIVSSIGLLFAVFIFLDLHFSLLQKFLKDACWM